MILKRSGYFRTAACANSFESGSHSTGCTSARSTPASSIAAIACSAENGSWRCCGDGVPFSQRWIWPSTISIGRILLIRGYSAGQNTPKRCRRATLLRPGNAHGGCRGFVLVGAAHRACGNPLDQPDDPLRHEDDEEDEQYPVDRVGRADEMDAEEDAQALVKHDRKE